MRCLRLKKKKEITGVLTKGKRVRAETLMLVYLPSDRVKFAVCVGKKYGGSVQRNRIKRLLRAAFYDFAEDMKPCSVLLLPKAAPTYAYASFRRDIGKLLKREDLLEDRHFSARRGE